MIAPPRPLVSLRPDIVFIDLEASGLGASSYPIEFAAVSDTLAPIASFLIRPVSGWTDWDDKAEQLHGITREMLMRDGLTVTDAVARMNEVLFEKTVVSDNHQADLMWIDELFRMSGEQRLFGVVEAGSQRAVLPGSRRADICPEQLNDLHERRNRLWPHTHRALPDALGLAALWRLTEDEAYASEVAAWEARIG